MGNLSKRLKSMILLLGLTIPVSSCVYPIPKEYEPKYADVNNDGKLDKISLNFAGRYEYHEGKHVVHEYKLGGENHWHPDYLFNISLGDGEGNFELMEEKIRIHWDPPSFDVQDFDGDGNLDIFYTLNGKNYVLKGAGNGTFKNLEK